MTNVPLKIVHSGPCLTCSCSMGISIPHHLSSLILHFISIAAPSSAALFTLSAPLTANATQKSKYSRQRIVEPSTDLHQISEATQNMEATLDVLISEWE